MKSKVEEKEHEKVKEKSKKQQEEGEKRRDGEGKKWTTKGRERGGKGKDDNELVEEAEKEEKPGGWG